MQGDPGKRERGQGDPGSVDVGIVLAAGGLTCPGTPRGKAKADGERYVSVDASSDPAGWSKAQRATAGATAFTGPSDLAVPARKHETFDSAYWIRPPPTGSAPQKKGVSRAAGTQTSRSYGSELDQGRAPACGLVEQLRSAGNGLDDPAPSCRHPGEVVALSPCRMENPQRHGSATDDCAVPDSPPARQRRRG